MCVTAAGAALQGAVVLLLSTCPSTVSSASIEAPSLEDAAELVIAMREHVEGIPGKPDRMSYSIWSDGLLVTWSIRMVTAEAGR